MSEFAWARLTARGPAPEPIRGTYGALTAGDISAALSGLKHRKFLAGMLVLAGDRSVMRELETHVYVRAMLLAAEQDWPMPQGPRPLRSLAKLVLLDVTAQGKPCKACEAKGYAVSQEGFQSQCGVCHGTTKQSFAESDLCEMAGIHPRTWSRTWAERYQDIYRDFCGDVEDAKRYLSRRLNPNA